MRQEGIDSLKRAHAANPTDVETMLKLSEIYLRDDSELAEAEKMMKNAKKLGEPRRGDGGSDMTREEKADAVTGESMEDAEAAEKSKDVPCRKQPPPAEKVPWPEKQFTTECATVELQQKPKMAKSGQVGPCVHQEKPERDKNTHNPEKSS